MTIVQQMEKGHDANHLTSGEGVSEYSVTEISQKIKGTIEQNLGVIQVRGEISGYTRASSGHLYFSLKDNVNVLSTVCWRYIADQISVKLEDGMEVLCRGKISTYGPRSSYQLVASRIQISGEGQLLAMLEERKKRLASQGYFDPAKKKPIPKLPQVIGVITSTSGVVIQDIINRVSERFPLHILVWDVAVQGKEASSEVSHAIKGFHHLSSDLPTPDLLIVARGGGSIEDLWPFNDEEIVKAVHDASIPIISAIGHETDVTLIDYAADLRAATPTAAAEKATPTREILLNYCIGTLDRIEDETKNIIEKYEYIIKNASIFLLQYLQNLEQYVAEIRAMLSHIQVMMVDKVAQYQYSLSSDYKEISHLSEKIIERRELFFQSSVELLESMSYKNVLSRGFAIVQDEKGSVVKSARSCKDQQKLRITLSDGSSIVGVCVLSSE